MFELNKIYNMDCIEGLKQMKDNSVQFVFTDPPYNQKKDYGIYTDNLSENEYENLISSVISEIRRVSNNNFAIFITPNLLSLFYKYIPDATLIITTKSNTYLGKKNYWGRFYAILSTSTPVHWISNVWTGIMLPGDGYAFKEKRFEHPGFTSLRLTEKIVSSFTNKGDLVLDPFIGVGTTAVASKRLGRNFIGFEINPEYCKMAEQRLSKTHPSYFPTEDWF